LEDIVKYTATKHVFH